MWVIAFSLGFFGSLHCLGMCGPLAIMFSKSSENSAFKNIVSGLSYNLGRTATYALLGLMFGTFSSFLFMAGVQKILSIILGILLVLTWLFSINIDHKINGIPLFSKFYKNVRNLISRMYSQAHKYPSFILGMANGLLPCGLVYLALIGALASGGLWQGVLFMSLFGLGTVPMLLTLMVSTSIFSGQVKQRLRMVLPYVSLVFGFFLIYRGIVVDMPAGMDFWEAIRNPIMCH